ncbi:hypothetical protein Q8A73_018180 [Channa argus]|nr:hypothetical protein Q8A73_018180 [Channa argus]
MYTITKEVTATIWQLVAWRRPVYELLRPSSGGTSEVPQIIFSLNDLKFHISTVLCSEFVSDVKHVGSSSGSSWPWWIIIVTVGLVALVMIVALVIRWKKSKGEKDTDPESEVAYTSISYSREPKRKAQCRGDDDGDKVTYCSVKAAGPFTDPGPRWYGGLCSTTLRPYADPEIGFRISACPCQWLVSFGESPCFFTGQYTQTLSPTGAPQHLIVGPSIQKGGWGGTRSLSLPHPVTIPNCGSLGDHGWLIPAGPLSLWVFSASQLAALNGSRGQPIVAWQRDWHGGQQFVSPKVEGAECTPGTLAPSGRCKSMVFRPASRLRRSSSTLHSRTASSNSPSLHLGTSIFRWNIR